MALNILLALFINSSASLSVSFPGATSWRVMKWVHLILISFAVLNCARNFGRNPTQYLDMAK